MEKHENLMQSDPNIENSEESNESHVRRQVTSLEDSASTPAEEDWEYVTGYKLTVVMAACTMAGFLMFLDTSIVATVS